MNGTSTLAARSAITTVEPDDPRYPALVRGQNQRWVSSPDRVHLPTTTGEVVDAVAGAVGDRKVLSVRSGGHCYEDFVDRDDVEVIVDLSEMTDVSWDTFHHAQSIRLP